MIKKRGKTAWTIALIVAIFLLILSASIAAPIWIRPFYYAQIDMLHLTRYTGYTYDQIKLAYDQMISYCTLYTPFGTGELAWSESGMSHFSDVRVLFTLDSVIVVLSTIFVIVTVSLARAGKIELVRFKGHGASFYAGIFAVAIPLLIGGLAAIDFDRAFEIFHAIFFPGKDNWLFNPSQDEIINVLPQEFFRNCALLIGAGVLVSSIACIWTDCAKKRKRKRAEAELPVELTDVE